jgi:hypothetical protein
VRGLVLGLAVLCLAATACQTLPTPGAPLSPADPRPAGLLAALASEREARHAIRASARVSLSGQRGGSFARQLLLVERPARLRVEVIGLVGQRVAVLATDGQRYDLYRSETGLVEHGEIHPGVLYEVAGIPLTPEQAVMLLLGAPETGAASLPNSVRLFPDGAIHVAWRGGGVDSVLEFDAEGRVRRYAVTVENGAALLRVAYDDYRLVAGVPFAHRVDFDFPRAHSRAEVAFRAVELNPLLSDDLFRIETLGDALAAGPRRP